MNLKKHFNQKKLLASKGSLKKLAVMRFVWEHTLQITLKKTTTGPGGSFFFVLKTNKKKGKHNWSEECPAPIRSIIVICEMKTLGGVTA